MASAIQLPPRRVREGEKRKREAEPEKQEETSSARSSTN